MSLADRRNKDQAMAARLKSQGVERREARCPLCHSIVSLERLPSHLNVCAARGEKAGKRSR